MGENRTCYIHIGTHKTGTSAIQGVLQDSVPVLARHGIGYPRSGRFLGGQHNLVFELMRDERFSPSHGTWADLSDELASERADRVCLSSEAFEYLYDRPADLAYVRERLRGHGFNPVIVMYVRPQAQYAASLFAELAKHRHTGSFEQFLDEVCRTGAFRQNAYGCTATFGFAYDAIASAFASAFGRDAVVVRRYPAALGAVVDDFLALLGGESLREAICPEAKRGRANGRQDLATVVREYAENAERCGDASGWTQAQLDLLREHERTLADAAFNPVGPSHVLKLARHFAGRNAALARASGVALPVASAGDIAAALAAALDPRPRAVLARRLLRVQRSTNAARTRARTSRSAAA